MKFIFEPVRSGEVNLDIAIPERVEGRRVVYDPKWMNHWWSCGGTYGMGGPGFFMLHLETTPEHPSEFLCLCIWGSSSWITVNGQWLNAHIDQHGQQRPLKSNWKDQWDDFGPMILDQKIVGFESNTDSTLIEFENGVQVRVDKDPHKRPPFPGGSFRTVPPTLSLVPAWKLVNTVPVLI